MQELELLERMIIKIIQGGMGVGISSPNLARIVSMLGGMGVVSAVADDGMLIRQIQLGDSTGEIRRAMEDYPDQNYVL